jgi:hypothetical protein
MSGMATAPSSGTATLDLFLSGQAFEVALNNVRARAHEQGEAGPGASRAAHAAGARGPVTPTVIVPPGPPVGRPPGATTTASALVEAKRLPAGESASGQRLAAGMAIASTPSMDEAACDGALAANDLRGDDTHGDTAPEIDTEAASALRPKAWRNLRWNTSASRTQPARRRQPLATSWIS